MVVKNLSYLCNACGDIFKKWSGRCTSCGAWNSMHEHNENAPVEKELHILNAGNVSVKRANTGYADADQVLGGGLVEGSVVLIGGDPGVGKSTLIMQIVGNISKPTSKSLYVSGEESLDQIRMRARRLGIENNNIMLLNCSNLQEIISAATANKSIKYVIIDSIQTTKSPASEGSPGSATQVKQCAHELSSFAKTHGITTIIIGHITKDGSVAGPKLLEHMVDAVLYFEGEKNYQFRVLRSIKNRYGPSNEIGIFRMTDTGLAEVPNPSQMLTGNIGVNISGSAIFAGVEGNRPLLLEIQALVAPTYMAYPRRTVVGWDSNRLDMILAVLHARCKLSLLDKEVYLNVVGGIRTQEPGADLAVALALISSAREKPFRHRYVAFGEIGLGGEVRPVSLTQNRIKEATKIGLNHIVLSGNSEVGDTSSTIIKVMHVRDLADL